MEKFRLTDNFLSKYENKQPNWGYGSLSYLTYKRTYSRLMENGKQEEFFDTIKRVVEGVFNIQLKHCKNLHLPWNSHKAQKSAQIMFEKMWNFKFLPPGRGLWMMGTENVNKIGSAALCNCGFVTTKDIDSDFTEPFTWACDMMMLGVGIGYDTLGADKVEVRGREWHCKEVIKDVKYQIPDTREGWVEALRLQLDSFTTKDTPYTVEFDYSLIRPAGMPIKGFGGTSSGHKPLMQGLNSLRELLKSYAGRKLDSVGIVDIFNFIGKFVVSGNVRRSAEIAMGNINDTNFIKMKDYNLFPKELNDRRWMSNNSVMADQNSDFSSIIDNIALNGEPGIIFLDNSRKYGRTKDGIRLPNNPKYDKVEGLNPCAEITLYSYELCNLVETFPANHETAEEYNDTLKYAYLYSKSVTLVPTHYEKTNQVMMQNRRIGCSQSGIQQAIKKFGIQNYLSDFCDKGYATLEYWDLIYSRWLGIPTSIKITTVKPSGTVSLLAGATPGIHCTHSEFYYRTVRIAANSPLIPKLSDAKYKIEVSVNDPNTMVVYFPVKENNFTKSKYDISLWEQLILVKELQYYWADNAISNTITFKKEEIKDLKSSIEYLSPYVKTLSFLPLDDHGYVQAPYQTITEDEYNLYSSSLLPLDLSEEKEEAKGEKYCSNEGCVI